ncbi:MAG: polysaccharide deacetylase family protein [Candidatus Saccharimonadales bacterium]
MSKKRLRRFFANPFIVVLPVVGLLWFGWVQFLETSRHLNTSANNMLPHSSFDYIEPSGAPQGWHITKNGNLGYTTSKIEPYASGNAFRLEVTDYRSGDISLASPKVSVKPFSKYLYKGYYIATVNFDLLVRYFYKDGSQRLELIRSYIDYDDPWSTISAAIDTGDSIQAVQFVYRIAANGSLDLDDTYLEEKTENIYIPPEPPKTNNLIPNGDFSAADGPLPKDWSMYHEGTNQTAFSYVNDAGTTFVRAQVVNFKNGEAKWQYDPLPVSAGEYFYFSADYQSDAPVDVVAEFVHANGQYEFDHLASMAPANEWTRIKQYVDVPSGVTQMTVLLILHKNGTLNTDNYFLSNVTKPGKPQFDRPLVSFTFDDGWLSEYDNGARLLDAQNYKATFYINPGTINAVNFLDIKMAEDLKNRGHHLASHGYDHIDMTAVHVQELDRHLKTARDYLQREFGLQAIDFATPYGRSDPEVLAYAHKYYRSHRGTESGINTRQNLDAHNLTILFIRTDTTPELIKALLNETKAKNGWLILTYHHIEDGVKSDVAITPKTFEQHIRIIKESGIAVKTVDAALTELQKQQ